MQHVSVYSIRRLFNHYIYCRIYLIEMTNGARETQIVEIVVIVCICRTSGSITDINWTWTFNNKWSKYFPINRWDVWDENMLNQPKTDHFCLLGRVWAVFLAQITCVKLFIRFYTFTSAYLCIIWSWILYTIHQIVLLLNFKFEDRFRLMDSKSFEGTMNLIYTASFSIWILCGAIALYCTQRQHRRNDDIEWAWCHSVVIWM